MPDEFVVSCPYCGEAVEIYVEPDVSGTFVQDCEVCCRPWRVRMVGRGDSRIPDVRRDDDSD
jgi:Cysteine-rich CPXCG